MALQGKTRKLSFGLTCGRTSPRFYGVIQNFLLCFEFLIVALAAFEELKVMKPGKRKTRHST